MNLERFILCFGFIVFFSNEGIAQDVHRAETRKTDWGSIESVDAAGQIQLHIEQLTTTDSVIELPPDLPPITRVYFGTPKWKEVRAADISPFIVMDKEGEQFNLHLPANATSNNQLNLVLETAERSQQYSDGRIVLSAMDAEVIGDTAKLESNGNNHRVGFWSNEADFVRWNYEATRPGNYDLTLTYSLAAENGSLASTIELAIKPGQTKSLPEHELDNVNHRLQHQLTGTGSWYQYQSVSLGIVRVPHSGTHAITVRCTKKIHGAVMNLKALTLTPSSEGTNPTQSDDGGIELHAKDATVCGTLLQWEPAPKKRTLGYWANASDFAYWDFEVVTPGQFEILIDQGCGSGSGGSTTKFSIYESGKPEPLAQFPHAVKDTGHWQNFETHSIGSVNLHQGRFRLRVKATQKAKNAVMDLQCVRLNPSD